MSDTVIETWSSIQMNSAPFMIRRPEVRALARLEGRRPACGRFILRGSPSGASAPQGSHLRMTGRYAFAIPRRDTPGVFNFVRAREDQRAQGMPDARCTRGLVCAVHKRTAHEHTGEAEASDIPC